MTNEEHWRTLMCCVCCNETPDESPLFQCNMGHIMCLTCFKDVKNLGNPRCAKCSSENFEKINVTSSFLYKLKNKPRVTRTDRYISKNCDEKFANVADKDDDDDGNYDQRNNRYNNNDEGNDNNKVTVERLFKASKEQIHDYFSQTFDESINKKYKMQLRNESENQGINYSGDNKSRLCKNSYASFRKNCSISTLCSRKPLICPHDPCRKIVAMSSFDTHFQYEHFDIRCHLLEKGKELCLPLDISKLDNNRTICLGLIKVNENNKNNIRDNLFKSQHHNQQHQSQHHQQQQLHHHNSNGSRTISNGHRKDNLDAKGDITCWIMLSCSQEKMESHSYKLIWLFTNNKEHHNCSIEVCSENCAVSYSVYCGINDMYSSQNITEVSQKLKYLHLSYGSVENLLRNGLNIQLRITIH